MLPEFGQTCRALSNLLSSSTSWGVTGSSAVPPTWKGPGNRAFSLPTHDLRHRRISLLHLAGVPWATIGQNIGQRDLAVTANTYSHVLADETELDYPTLLA